MLVQVIGPAPGPLEAEATAGGHALWRGGDTPDVVVVDGELATLRRLRVEQPAVDTLFLAADAQVAALHPDDGPFAVHPLAPGELALRLRHIAEWAGAPAVGPARLLSKAVASLYDIVELTDADAVLQYVNPAYERVLGWAPHEAIGRRPSELIRSDFHDAAFWAEIDRTLAAGDTWQGRIVSAARDGTPVWFDVNVSPVSLDGRRITHHVAVRRDVTEVVRREEALQALNQALAQARDVARSADRAKSEFVARVSHELRTPLHGMLGYCALLSMDATERGDADLATELDRVRGAGSHLLALANELLELSRAERGRLEVRPEDDVDVARVLQEVVATARPLAWSNTNRFVVDLAPDLGTLRTDPTRLAQVVLNLLGNAFKFTDAGEVLLRARRDEALVVQVIDTGCGMDAETAERVFGAFEQGEVRLDGVGLGLTISRYLTGRLGGTLLCDSAVAAGTTFTLTLPPGGPRPPTPELVLADDGAGQAALRAALERSTGAAVRQVAVADTVACARPDTTIGVVLVVRDPSGWAQLSALKLDPATAGLPVVVASPPGTQSTGLLLGATRSVALDDPSALASAVQEVW